MTKPSKKVSKAHKRKKESNSHHLPLARLLPNVVTIIGMCFGLFSLKYAMSGQWEYAVAFIVIAGFIDGMDGRLARLLNATSEFGVQLDSLADFFNFGVAPAMLLYLWQTHEIKGVGWAIALFFVISQALRLARYNTGVEEEDPELDKIKESFFVGMPAPLGGTLSTAPIMVQFFMEKHFPDIVWSIPVEAIAAYLVFIAFMMVSRVPTVSVKKIRIKRSYSLPAIALIGMVFIAMIIEPWAVLPLIGLIYLVSIPFSIIAYYRISKVTPSHAEKRAQDAH